MITLEGEAHTMHTFADTARTTVAQFVLEPKSTWSIYHPASAPKHQRSSGVGRQRKTRKYALIQQAADTSAASRSFQFVFLHLLGGSWPALESLLASVPVLWMHSGHLGII